MTRLFSSLTGRMVMGILLVHLVMLPLLFGGVLYIVQQGYQSQFIEHSRAHAGLLTSLLDSNIEAQQVRDQLDDACLTGKLSFAQILSTRGAVLFSCGDVPDAGNIREDFYFGEHADEIYHLSTLISGHDDREFGELHLGYMETDTRAQIDLAYQRGLLFAAVYVTATFLLMLLFGNKLTHPIRHLQHLSRRIAHGHYEEELAVDTQIIEIRDLAANLEDMRHELVAQHSAMEHQSLHDSLTNLPNRALLNDRLEQAFSLCKDTGQNLSLILIDLDRFKDINDTLGHLTGDLVLKETAERLRGCIRGSDTVARLGGDEFAILLPTSEQQSSERIAGEVARELAKVYQINDHHMQLGGSIGIAMYPQHGEDYETLLRRADIAMYAAKRKGGGFLTYHSDLDRHTRRQVIMTTELREAIDSDQLRMHYQAKMNLASDRICCVEALVRWQHPERGLIPPNDFIPLAERTGLIDPMTRWVLRDCIRQCAAWLSNGMQLAVAVNLSAHSLHDLMLPEFIDGLLKEYAVPAKYLELELTESALFSDPARALEILLRIDAMGVRLSIDDFGTGYSSMQQLRKLPVSQIKIDRSFVMDMTRDENDLAIVRATIHLAHDLNVAVVAEGVEDKETLEMLRAHGCDLIQGYYLSRPLPVDKFEQWISQQKHATRKSA